MRTQERDREDTAMPFEIIEEILWRLPAKSLWRFRCVCKSWNELLRDTNFIKRQLNRSIHNDPSLLLVSGRKVFSAQLQGRRNRISATELHLPFVSGTEIIELVGSCNGLICFTLTNKPTVHLWNPSTGYYKALPDVYYVRRRFDYDLGFGYSPGNDEYKVVRFVNPDPYDYVSEAIVHTLGTNSWRSVECFPDKIWVTSYGVSMNGTIHWLVDGNQNSSIRTRFIACFDVEREKFGWMLLPDFGVSVGSLTLAVLGGLLTISYQAYTYFDAWVMLDYGDERSWTRQISESLTKFRGIGLGLQPLGIRKSGEIVIYIFCERIALYDPRTKKVRFIGIYGKPPWFRACSYVESLISLGVAGDSG